MKNLQHAIDILKDQANFLESMDNLYSRDKIKQAIELIKKEL